MIIEMYSKCISDDSIVTLQLVASFMIVIYERHILKYRRQAWVNQLSKNFYLFTKISDGGYFVRGFSKLVKKSHYTHIKHNPHPSSQQLAKYIF